jgi:predicted amidophosphoribosyltransferase
MTREEAITDIRDNIKPIVGGKSLDMAIKALEQLTPKKVGYSARLVDLHKGVWKKVGGYKCPECNADVKRESRFCPRCGQAIDWRTK